MTSWTTCALGREPREWALFDPDLSKRRSGWSLGAAQIRDWSDAEWQRGATLEIWGSLRTARGIAFAELRQAVVLRGFEGPTFVAGVSQGLYAGLALGAFELGAGAALTPVGADISRGRLALDVLSPETALRLGFDIGPVHIGFRGYVQYLARLFGREDAVLQGLTLDVGLLRPSLHRSTQRIEPYHR